MKLVRRARNPDVAGEDPDIADRRAADEERPVADLVGVPEHDRRRLREEDKDDGVRLGGLEAERLRRPVGRIGRDLLVRHRLDALELEGFDERVVPAASPVVVLGDDGDPLHAQVDCVLHLSVALHPSREHRGEDARVHRIGEGGGGGGGDDPGDVGGDDLGLRGKARVGAGAAVDHEDLVLVNQLLDRADGLGGLAAVVLADVLDLATVYPARRVGFHVDGFDAVVDGVAELGVGTGEDAKRPDLDGVVGHAGLGRGRYRVHRGGGEGGRRRAGGKS